MCGQDTPDFSVVVASFSGEDALLRCLHHLEPQCAGGEIIVAANLAHGELAELQRRFPQVRFVPGSESSTVFQLRAIGLSAARGNWIALTEDHCIPEAGWIAALKTAIGCEGVIVAGPVVPGGAVRWADGGLFLCEYANLHPPLRSDQLDFVSGVNAAFPRAALQGCRCVWRDGFYENEVSDALRELGYSFDVAPEAAVRSRISMSFGAALAHFFEGGKRFGRYRSTRLAKAVQAWRLTTAPLVPFVLFTRILRLALTRLPPLAVLASIPTIAPLVLAWSLGEFAGYCRGAVEPGQIAGTRFCLRASSFRKPRGESTG